MSSLDFNTIKKKVVSIVMEKLNIDSTALEQSSNLQDIGADSLDMVEIVMKLEEEFNIRIDDYDVEKLESLDEIATYINQKIKS